MQEGTRRVQRWGADATTFWQYGTVYGRAAHKPEQRLMAALLMDALVQFEKACAGRDPRARRMLHELQAWFYADDDSWPFSFENVCEHLRLEPDAIRGRLARIQRAPRTKQPDTDSPT